VPGEQHQDFELRQRQVRGEERIGPVVRKQLLHSLMGNHNVRDELFVPGQRQPFLVTR
jgi:hypothetical protein